MKSNRHRASFVKSAVKENRALATLQPKPDFSSVDFIN